jgi:hypothetical protein
MARRPAYRVSVARTRRILPDVLGGGYDDVVKDEFVAGIRSPRLRPRCSPGGL